MSGTQETALTLARELSGAGEAEEALLELLCQAAEQQWEKRLRPGMTTEDCGKAFPCAVAFTAAADLAAVIALASSYLDRPVPGDLVAIGEVGLTGELRSVNQLAQRVSEVHRLGFRKCVVPAHRANTIKAPAGLTVIPARNIGEAIRAALRPAE